VADSADVGGGGVGAVRSGLGFGSPYTPTPTLKSPRPSSRQAFLLSCANCSR
jgi:hypothetical protein